MITARKRMALFPSKDVEVSWNHLANGRRRQLTRCSLTPQVIFPAKELWVPVVRMRGRLCILPGIPRLFEVCCTAAALTYERQSSLS